MTKADRELDEYGRKVLEPLHPSPALDPRVKAEEKARFLLLGENLRKSIIPNLEEAQPSRANRKPDSLRGKLSLSFYKALVIIIIVALFVAGSSLTVYAAQNSLPGEPLYTVKSVSEDVRMSMTFSTEAKLNLTLDYTTRRMGEISTLVSHGKSLPDKTSDRFQVELEDALELATQLNDQQMQKALIQIKILAEEQGMTMDELISGLPDQASPAIIRLKERLQEQIQLSTIGEKNPQAFRKQIRDREHNRHGPKGAPVSDESEAYPAISPAAPIPEEDNGGINQPTEMPERGSHGNGNHGPNPTHTPKP